MVSCSSTNGIGSTTYAATSEISNSTMPSATVAHILDDYGYSDIPQLHLTVDILSKNYSDATMSLYSASGALEFSPDINIKIKIRGNTSYFYDKKPYNLKFDSEVGLLGMPSSSKWILLANRIDKSLMRNKLAYDFASQLSFAYTVQAQYVDLWINDIYKGNYLLTTPISVAENKVNINTDNNEFLLEREAARIEEGVTYIETPVNGIRYQLNAPSTLTDAQTTYLLTLLGNAETAIADRAFVDICKYIDVQTFIDFYIVQELFKNLDVDFSSSRLYIRSGKIYAGPIWDMDLSCGNANPAVYKDNHNSAQEIYAFKRSWIKDLLLVSEFKELFVARYNELQPLIVNLYTNNSLGSNRIDILQSKYKAAFLRDSSVAGWNFVSVGPDSAPYQTYDEYVEYLRNWLKERNEWLLVYLNSL